jgi:hypothetical protein
MRANPAVRLAPCDMKGDNVGTYVAGTARILEGHAKTPFDDAIAKK